MQRIVLQAVREFSLEARPPDNTEEWLRNGVSATESQEPQHRSFRMKTCREHEALRNLPLKTSERQRDEREFASRIKDKN